MHGTIARDARLVWCQRVVELVAISTGGDNKEGLRTHAVILNGNALFVLSLKGVSEETNSKVHSRGPHAVSVGDLSEQSSWI